MSKIIISEVYKNSLSSVWHDSYSELEFFDAY